MSNTVSPARSTSSEVRVMIKNPLVNITQYHLPFSAAQYSHGDQADVTVLRFWLFLDKSCLSRIKHPKSECFDRNCGHVIPRWISSRDCIRRKVGQAEIR
ncbi:hypothetical protein T4B_2720 [Trichinella pseudospiralis]|uniref:Uncharacterized protein n=1 Tax=Trichinella pseudospiralis TaxID=6337 RepID=A0A0V1ITW7_TRIPS|nr:hypothetical protein T4A_3796 [Trichinella pseudospiralis]KRZ26228.1 hypothetical protein T4B_2720 [Trichinella pseudospiralis]